MYDLIKNIIGYSGSETVDQIIVGASAAVIIIVGIVVIDNIFRIFKTIIDFTRR